MKRSEAHERLPRLVCAKLDHEEKQKKNQSDVSAECRRSEPKTTFQKKKKKKTHGAAFCSTLLLHLCDLALDRTMRFGVLFSFLRVFFLLLLFDGGANAFFLCFFFNYKKQ
jgi:hypothetical protein